MNSDRLLKTFLDLVQMDSETGNERQVADYCLWRLKALGYTVEEDKAGEAIGGNAGNILAWKEGCGQGKSILLCAHMDTVKPGCGVAPVINDGVITSAGDTILGGDDKAGIAAILEAATVAAEEGWAHGPLKILFTIAEEGGLDGARNVDYQRLLPIDGAFFFDSGELPNHIVVIAPTQYSIEATFRGKAAHAGMEPEKGVSAIQMAAAAISAMRLGRIDQETTANVGLIMGGMATNIVPETVTIKGETRSLAVEKVEAQRDHMAACCREAAYRYGGTVDIDLHEAYAGINLSADCTAVRLASQAARALGLEPVLCTTGGGSDANIFNGYGIEAVNLGIGMSKVHTTDEYIKISDLVLAAQAIGQLIKAAAQEETV